MSNQRGALKRFIWAVLPALLALLLYAPTLTHGYFTDDLMLIVDNPYLKRWDGVIDLVSRDLWAASGLGKSTEYYRPLPMLTFWLQTLTFGSAAAWLRLGNVVLLGAGGMTLAALLKRQWPTLSQQAATLIACAWVAHPLNTEATIWLSGRFDLLLMLGVLGVLALNLTASRRWSVPLVFAGSMLCKEPALVLLPVLLIQDYFGKRRLRDERFKAVNLLLVAGAYLGLRQVIGVAGAEVVHSSAPLVLIQSYATLLAVFGRLLLLPIGLDPRHWYAPVPWPLAIGLLALAAAAVANAAWHAIREPQKSGLLVGVALSALSLIPVALIGPNQQIYGDRFASLFVVGLAVASGHLQRRMSRASQWLQRTIAIALLGAWSLLTVLRGNEWVSEERLTECALRDNPEHPDWRVLQSHQLLEQGNPQAAIAVLSAVARANPGYAKAWNALCVGYLRTAQTPQAHQACERALRLDSGSPTVWLNWGTVHVAERHWSEAIQAGTRALQIRPAYPEAEYVVAVSLAQLGQLAEAEQHVMRGLADEPSHPALNDLKGQLDRRRPR